MVAFLKVGNIAPLGGGKKRKKPLEPMGGDDFKAVSAAISKANLSACVKLYIFFLSGWGL